ncbi:helix-turn-helix domain-containing protein [Dactylosporangium sp. NPDC000244]|uniref:GlxA family transcriptional regulator n=1 Tax=Dactylosporangium sp. NPDC000244 TaxID=3154365 RepID=UPI00331740AB
MSTVAVAVADGVLHFELALAYELFGSAAPVPVADWYEVVICGAAPVRADGRFLLEPDAGLEQLARAGTVIVPGWAELDADPPADLVAAVRAAHEAGARVASLCTGAFVLAAAERLDEPLTVEDLARRANLSSRHLARHFRAATGTTPLRWLLTERIRRAQELLEHTDDGLDAIAAATGLGTAATLRRHFHRVVGVAPGEYRRTFRDRRDAAGLSG